MSADPGPDPPSDTSHLWQTRRYYRQSRAAIVPCATIGVAITTIGLVMEAWGSGCSLFVWIVVMVLAWFGFIGDVLNVIVLHRRIARAERDVNRA